jgi:peptidyl-prolyl cis-trans isomerase D
MISWIQHHLIRHGRWIFLSLLAVIIVAFVFTIGNTPGLTTDRSGYEENLFYGIDLNSPLERDQIIEKVQISAFLNGQQIRDDAQFQNLLTSRIALLHLADTLGVPGPDQAALSDYITTKRAFLGADGNFSPDAYTRFIDNVESNPQTPSGIIARVLEEDYRIERVNTVLSGPGFILPSEILAQAQRNRTELTLSTASLDYRAFEPEIAAEESTLRDYYEANAQRYEIAERIRASYVFFDRADYAANVPEPTDADLRAHFIADRERFVQAFETERELRAADAAAAGGDGADGEEAAPAADEAPVTFEDVREAVAADFREAQEIRMANQAAQDFAFTLYDEAIARESAAFNALLNESGLSLTPIPPYTRQGARQRALPPEMLEAAFALGGNRYYSDAYPVDDGFAVLIYEGRIAPQIPDFEAVRSEVEADYRAEEKRRLFNEKGAALQAQLEAALEEGGSFAESAEALGLETESFASFSVAEAPAGLNQSALRQAQGMRPGEISSMLTVGNTGIFVHLADKIIPEVAADDPDLAQAESFLAQFTAFSSRNAFINELVARGIPEERIQAE